MFWWRLAAGARVTTLVLRFHSTSGDAVHPFLSRRRTRRDFRGAPMRPRFQKQTKRVSLTSARGFVGHTELLATTRVACGRQPIRHICGAPRQIRTRLARSHGAGAGDAAASVNYYFVSTPSTRFLTELYTGARCSACCTGGPRTPRRAQPAATIGAATTAARSWRPRSRPRISGTSPGPKPRLAGTPRPRTHRQSRWRRTEPRRRNGTRAGSATTALASRRRRRACGPRGPERKQFIKLAPLAAPRKNPPRAA